MDAALAAARALAPLTGRASGFRSRSRACWRSGRRYARPIADDDPFASRERRARAAIVEMLPSLAAVHAAHDDPAWTIDELGIAVRRWIEDQTFVAGSRRRPRRAPARRSGGPLRRLRRRRDRRPRRQDWPERPRRNIFYPPALLKSLGWPSEKDRRGAGDARFLDLLTSASRRTHGLDLHARRGRDRLALDAARRDSARPAVDGRARAVRGRAGVRGRGAVARAGRVRAVRRARRARWAELRTQRSPADAAGLPRHGARRRRRAPGRSARSRPISTARSSSSRSTCCGSRRSPRTRR